MTEPVRTPRPPKTQIRLPTGAVYRVRPAKVSDAPEVTDLIHDAFEIWKEKGLKLGPMFQTVEQTKKHLKGKGVVAENVQGKIVGTFSLDEGAVARAADGSIAFVEGDEVVRYPSIGPAFPLPAGRLLVFKKAAVRREKAHRGLGSRLYALAEQTARQNGYEGMILETVKEAGWLYDWYVHLGFTQIGAYRYPGREVDTVLMIKPFGTAK